MNTVDAKTLTDILKGASSYTALHVCTIASGMVEPEEREPFIEFIVNHAEMAKNTPEGMMEQAIHHMRNPQEPDGDNSDKLVNIPRYNIHHLFKYAVSSVAAAVRLLDAGERDNPRFINEVLDATSSVYVLMRLGRGAEGFWDTTNEAFDYPAGSIRRTYEAINEADAKDRLDTLYALNEAKNALAMMATPDVNYFGEGEDADIPFRTRIQTLQVLTHANSIVLKHAEQIH